MAKQKVEYRTVVGKSDYRVGTDGSIWRRTRKGWRQFYGSCDKDGYIRVALSHEGRKEYFYLSNLILTAFVGPRPVGMVACHAPDPTKTNNAATNLRWDSQANNVADKHAHGTWQTGETHPMHKLTAEQVRIVRAVFAQYPNDRTIRTQLAARFDVSYYTIWSITNGRTWQPVN